MSRTMKAGLHERFDAEASKKKPWSEQNVSMDLCMVMKLRAPRHKKYRFRPRKQVCGTLLQSRMDASPLRGRRSFYPS